MLCEGFLGVDPHFELWKYFFSPHLQKPSGDASPYPIGSASIYLRSSRASEYIRVPLLFSVKGWQRSWFYLKATNLLAYMHQQGVQVRAGSVGLGPGRGGEEEVGRSALGDRESEGGRT